MFLKRSERGQGSLEVVGVVAIAALLVAAVTTAVVQTSPGLTGSIKDGICRVVTLGQGSCDTAPTIRTAEDHIPPEECVIGSSGQETESKASLVVTLSSGETWLIENLGNGKARLTRSTSGGVGIGVGAGFDVSVKVDGSKYGVALTASAEAMLKSIEGEVFYANNAQEAEDILNGQKTDDTKDFWWGDGGPIRDVADWAGGEGEHENDTPDEWFEEGGFEVSGYAGATALYETAEAQASEEAYLGTRHKKDGTRTDYFRAKASAMAGVDAWTGDGTFEAAAQGEMESLVEIERDKDGNPVSMTMTSTLMGHADAGDKGETSDPEYTQRTIQIPLKSESDRDVASRVLWMAGIPFMPGINEGITDSDAVGAPWQLNEIAKDLAQVANDRGYLSEQTYTERTTNDDGFTFDAKLIAELGLGGSDKATETNMTDYKYWDGSQMASRPGCVGAGGSSGGGGGSW